MPPVRFAIVDTNILVCIGLQQLLSDLLPMAEVLVFSSIEELKELDDPQVLHYFVSSRIYFEHTQFFRNHPKKAIVLVNGDMSIHDVYTLNVCQSEQALIRDIMALQHKGNDYAMTMAQQNIVRHDMVLSARETEVAVLLCRGLINKEIADRLDLGITTIITHRKNIMEKLHAHSLADVIIYCVVNGIVNIEDLGPIGH